MPKGPQGQKRPADVIGAAFMIARIATGELADPKPLLDRASQQKGGLRGGVARAQALTKQERIKIAKKGAKARWENK